MSEQNQPRLRIGGIPAIAEKIWERFEEGANNVTELLPLSDEKTLRVRVAKSRIPFGKRLTVSLEKSVSCCVPCREAVEEMGKKTLSVESLTQLLLDVANHIQRCNDCSNNGAVAATPGATPAASQSPAALEPAGSRVKVVGDGAPAGATAAPVAQQAESKTIKISDSGGAKSHGSVLQLGRGRPATSPPPGHIHHSVSVSYFHARTRVEVTIPHYICEELVSHCGGSNQHNNEVGGLLVGLKEEVKVGGNDSKQLRVVVTDLVRLKAAASSVSHLEVSADEWARVGRTLDEKYVPQNKVRLGWYHTHPTQGIFFSPQDIDTHKNFTLPYQFGLVISPREMVAGLLYWVSYPEGVSDPIKFPLRRIANVGTGTGGGVSQQQIMPTDLPPLSKGRVIFVGWVTMLVFSLVIITSPPYSTTPDNACLLAFNVFAILRLMNARFFRPSDPFEQRVFGVARNTYQTFADWFDSWAPIPFTYTSILLLFAAILLLLVRYQTGWVQSLTGDRGQQPRQPVAEKQQPQGVNDPGPGNRRNVQTKRLQISRESDSSMTVYYEGNKSIVFYKSGQNWSPANPDMEQDFFNRTFNLDLRDGAAVRAFQKWVYGTSRQTDGLWGGQTRNAVLDFLRSAKSTGTPLNVQWRDGLPELVIDVK